uniref:Uncharacterized protein n=1 Tax=Ixodes ricinus TaxID=34613 RepID=A0A6B0U258_IXORI
MPRRRQRSPVLALFVKTSTADRLGSRHPTPRKSGFCNIICWCFATAFDTWEGRGHQTHRLRMHNGRRSNRTFLRNVRQTLILTRASCAALA